MAKQKETEIGMLEGTWEEIKQHERELTGRRFRLMPLSETGASLEEAISADEEERLLDELAAAGERLMALPPEANRREWVYRDHD